MTIIKADIDARYLSHDKDKEAAVIAQMLRGDSNLVGAYLRAWARLVFGDHTMACQPVSQFAQELNGPNGATVDDRSTIKAMADAPFCTLNVDFRRWASGPDSFSDDRFWPECERLDCRRLPLHPLLMEIALDVPSYWQSDKARETAHEKWVQKRKLKGLMSPKEAPHAPGPKQPVMPQPATAPMYPPPPPPAPVAPKPLVTADYAALEQRVAAQLASTMTTAQAASLYPDCLSNPSKSSGETTMNAPMQATAARRLVKVRIIDNDRALLVEHASVADLGPFMTEDSDQTTIMQALTDYDINDAIAKHNKVRGELTDEAILKATGQDVKLRPVKLKDLTIFVIPA